ncbi:MAG: DUF4825 domain-containing protein [Clostridia bacterium]|nr:DUF4825 domain-containing protein [Clostridia bacterium]
MKNRNKAILILIVAGVVLYGVVQGIIIPDISNKREQYIIQQQDALTHDLGSVLKYKDKYMGNAPNITNLFNSLPLCDVPMTFQFYPDSLTVEVKYQKAIDEIGMQRVERALIYNSTAAFMLIDNLEAIIFTFYDEEYKVLRGDVEKWYDIKLSSLADDDIWYKKVQCKLNDDEYISTCKNHILDRN